MTESSVPKARYWTDGEHLYCRHGIILYGRKCLTCEREAAAKAPQEPREAAPRRVS